MNVTIRVLGPADAVALFRLRRQALLEAPEAFLASPEDDLASSEAAVREQLGRGPESVVFGAMAEHVVGMLGVRRAQRLKTAHKVDLWGMFVDTTWRSQGLGERLLRAALAHCRTLSGVASVHLGVSESAQAAKRLYERVGFTVWAVEPDAMRYRGKSIAEHHLALSVSSIAETTPSEMTR
jgi:ribosomal protein S18 acetylase RimI-like enzyme